jgi:hypothetical protein
MLLELQNTNKEDINKLLAFAQQNNLQLTVFEDSDNNYHLPGKPLTAGQLDELIINSRKSGTVGLSKIGED